MVHLYSPLRFFHSVPLHTTFQKAVELAEEAKREAEEAEKRALEEAEKQASNESVDSESDYEVPPTVEEKTKQSEEVIIVTILC